MTVTTNGPTDEGLRTPVVKRTKNRRNHAFGPTGELADLV
jgi:hypothetical protein